MDIFSQVSIAVQRRLNEVFLPDKWRFEVCADPMTLREFQRIIGTTPTLAFAWNGFEPGNQARAVTGKARFALTIIVKNEMSPVARLVGDARGPGLWPSVQTAIKYLHGATLGDLCSLAVTKAQSAYAEGVINEAMAMARIDFETTLTFPPEPADEFLRMVNSFTAPPFPPEALPQDPIIIRP
jgi:hypothetical protein